MLISAWIKITPRRLWRYFLEDSLFRNSIYLTLSTAVQAVFGFIFWVSIARFYSPESIGIGSSLISASIFISYVSLLGLNGMLVKFLPTSTQRSEKINTSLTLVGAATFVIASGYILTAPQFVPSLEFLQNHFTSGLIFVMLSTFIATNLLTDSIFIAYRASEYNVLVYTLQGLVKLVLPIMLISFGAMGIFVATGIAAGSALVLSMYFASRKFNYTPRICFDMDIVRLVWKFSFSNYVANLLNTTPILLLPIIIINALGPAQAGYYYLAFMVCNLLYAVAYAMSQSLFAESSHGDSNIKQLVRRSVNILTIVIIPAGLILAYAGPLLLQVFGKTYSGEASNVIVVLSLGAPAIAAYAITSALLRMKNHMHALVFVNLVYTLVICGLAVAWVHKGIVWVAVAFVVGHLASAFAALLFIGYSTLCDRLLTK